MTWKAELVCGTGCVAVAYGLSLWSPALAWVFGGMVLMACGARLYPQRKATEATRAQ